MESKHTDQPCELRQFWQGGVTPMWEIKYETIVATIVDHDQEHQSFEKRENVAAHIVKCVNSHDAMSDLIKTLEEYVFLLDHELSNVSSIAFIHGYKPKQIDIESGASLRERIGLLKSTIGK